MIAIENTQSLAEFRTNVDETLDRVNQTGEAEVITVDGRPRGVLLAPAVYDEMAREALLARDAAVIRRSIEQLDAGQGQNLAAVSAELRAKLLAIGAVQ